MNSVRIRRGLFNPITLSTSIVFLFGNLIVSGIAFFLPTVIRTIYHGETVIQMQLRTVPVYIVAAACLLAASYVSTRTDKHQVFLVASGPLVMLGYAMLIGTTIPEARYAACFLATSTIFIGGAMTNAQVSANTISDSSRSMAIATNSIAGYLGGLVATWTYLPWDGPMYPIGNGINLAASGGITLISLGTYFWMKYDNRKRDRVSPEEVQEKLRGLSQQQISNLEWKHPEFRWKP